MAPAKRKRPRFSADKSVHLLGSLSGSPTTNRRHTTRLDPIHDILPSPESRKRSRRSEPIPRRRRPRTRQNNRQLTSEPDEPEPEPRSDSIAEIFEEAESHKRSRIASDYEHAEEATRFQNGGEAQEEEEEEEEEEEDDDDYDEPPLFGDQNEADEDAAGHQLGMELSAEDAEETNTYSIDILGEYNDDEDEVVGYHLETEMDDENSDNEDIKSATPQNGEENESIGLSDHQNDEENLARHQLDIEMDTGDEHDEEGDDGGDGGEHDEDGDDMNENGSSGPVQGQGEANTTEDCRLPRELPTANYPRTTQRARKYGQPEPTPCSVGVHVDEVIDSTQSSMSHGYAETIASADEEGRQQSVQPDERSGPQHSNTSGQLFRDLDHWFNREVKKTGAESDWRNLNEKGQGLQCYASRPRPDYLRESFQLLKEYVRLYTEEANLEILSQEMEDQMKNVKDMIVTEAGQLFEHASEQLQDSTVLDQFEAHFIPRFISLTQLAFRVYQATNSLAHQQLRHTFDLIFVCVETLIGGYFNSGLLEPKFRSRGLVAPLRRVMKALDSGQLIAHGTTQRKRGPEVFADIPPVVKGWSQGEIQVLRDAYIQYFDDADPVLMIAKRQGHKLPRRSMRDIKGMLKEIGLLVD